MELWLAGQSRPNPELTTALQRARMFGAKWLKVSLGYFTDNSDLHSLGRMLGDNAVQLLVENDQTSHGGRIEPFQRFFNEVTSPPSPTSANRNWRTLMSEIDILSFGETMAMFVAEQAGDLASVNAFHKRIAGADSNVAIGLSRLGFKVAWLSRVGADSLGRFVIDTHWKRKAWIAATSTSTPRTPPVSSSSRAPTMAAILSSSISTVARRPVTCRRFRSCPTCSRPGICTPPAVLRRCRKPRGKCRSS
jgi:hypothetical protein